MAISMTGINVTGKAGFGLADIPDPFYSNVSLLMHMDGVNNGTSFIDEKDNTVTRSGNTVTETAIKKYGTAAAIFDGSGDYLTVSGSGTNTAFDFSSGIFTIELWINFNSLVGEHGIITKWSYVTESLRSWALITLGNTLQLTSYPSSIISQSMTVSTGVWYFLAISSDGTNTRLFLDGNLLGTAGSASFPPSKNIPVIIGAYAGGNNSFDGYMDEIRLTKGIARYTGNFTPPTKAFPNS